MSQLLTWKKFEVKLYTASLGTSFGPAGLLSGLSAQLNEMAADQLVQTIIGIFRAFNYSNSD